MRWRAGGGGGLQQYQCIIGIQATVYMILWCVCMQAVQAKVTSHIVQALVQTDAGQSGLLQGLQQALADRPELKTVLNKVLHNVLPDT